MRNTLLFVVTMGLSAAVAAQAYKWVDKDGKVRYGDQPPPGVQATPLKGPPPPASSAPSAAAKKGDKPLSPEAAFQKRQQERAEADQKAARANADDLTKKTNCDQAQAALRTLQSGQRISTTNAQGERVYLSDDERDREMARVQGTVREWCPR